MVDLKDIDREEYERRKRAIFESMSKRGQERILKRGYENWDPFVEPKDPRERLISDPARRAMALLVNFYETSEIGELARAYHRDLFDLASGLLRGEAKARVIFGFCKWYEKTLSQENLK